MMSASSETTQQIAINAQNEAGALLDLFAAQLQGAMDESEVRVNALTEAFSAMDEQIEVLLKQMNSAADIDQARLAVFEYCRLMRAGSGKIVAAFQFYDRLTQQIQHVQNGLSAVAGALYTAARTPRSVRWPQVYSSIRERFTIERERLMFDLLIGHIEADTALKESEVIAVNAEAGRVELF